VTEPAAPTAPDAPRGEPRPAGGELGELALALITSRHSVSPKNLVAPGPDESQLLALLEAAASAPDHKEQAPFRFIRIGDGQRERLARAFEAALVERDANAEPADRARAREKAFRAPTLLLAVARLEPAHPDVPARERFVSLGAALMGLLLAAHGLGFAGMLTSGRALRLASFARVFGLAEGEEPVCFVSIGTPLKSRRRVRPQAQSLLSDWQPPG
jgi:nitroreductase